MFCWYLLNYAIVFSDPVAVLTARHLPVRAAKPWQVHQSQGGIWRIQRNLQLEGDVARRLRLAVISHIYLILPYIVHHSCLLARTTRVGVTIIV